MAHHTRRSPRVQANIPITIRGGGPAYEGMTAVINRQGALVLVPVEYKLGTAVSISNQHTRREGLFVVVWNGGLGCPGIYRLGVELLQETSNFWGVDYLADEPISD